MKRFGALAILVAVSAIALTGQAPAPALAITHVNVIPMTRDELLVADQTVVVTGDRITAMGLAGSTAIPKGAQVVDGRGKYLIPGLADMHVHLEYFDDPAMLGLFVDNGVTTVRNMDGRPYILDWKKRIAAGTLAGPRIYTAGPLLDGSPPVRPDNTVVATEQAARDAVVAQAAEGYDFIKVYSGLSIPAYRAILAAAKEKRLPVAGHIPRAVATDFVLRSGQVSVEHLGDFASAIEANDSPFKGVGHWSKRYLAMPLDPAKLRGIAQRLVKSGVRSVPTLIQPERETLRPEAITERLASDEVQRIPADGRKQWEGMARRVAARMDEEDWKLVAAGRANRLLVVGAFRAARVSLLAGSDTPNPFVVPGFSLHDELGLLVAAGLSPAEALAAATREAARFLKASEWGTIERGKIADLLLLHANPLERIANTRRLAAIVVRGRLK